MVTVQTQILGRIQQAGRGKVFISKDFLDLGSREAVDQALSRLARTKEINRLGRGLYYHPQVNERLGIQLTPQTDEIAEAVARQTGSQVVPSGAVAANLLGLSTQVPAQPVYLTNGRTRKVEVGGIVLTVKHVSPRELPTGRRTAALVIQALRHIGQAAVDSEAVSRLKKALSRPQRQELLDDTRYTTGWIADIVRQVAVEDATDSGMLVHG